MEVSDRKRTAERIKNIIDFYNMTEREFCMRCDIYPTAFKQIKDSTNGPGGKFLFQLSKNFPDVNMNYIFRGEEPMIIDRKANFIDNLAERVALLERRVLDQSEVKAEPQMK